MNKKEVLLDEEDVSIKENRTLCRNENFSTGKKK